MSRSVREEIKQKKPFQSAGQEAVLALLRTASLARRRFESLANDHGITFQQFNVLRILRGAGEPLPTMEVADRMIEPEPGITRLIERLQRKKLVKRLQDPDDGRRSLCAITGKGLEVLAGLDTPVARMDDEVLGALNEGQLKSLIRLLDKARSGLHTARHE